ncbi:unnamed protein product [Mytilus edulis]|uniref:Uncharacterized protein n=1 Tax=Mytilus edulis TaxID=6550 RepID=A0A8S3U6A6_MYTED|nr:unnamed protein product [Mytilus edulis]
MYRIFTKNRNHRYVDILEDIVKTYNKTPHKSLNNIAPQDVNKNNETDLWAYMYLKPRKTTGVTPYKFKINDMVRIPHVDIRKGHHRYNRRFRGNMSLYVILSSNKSLEYFPENVPSKFRSQLGSPLNMNGMWKVALVEANISSSLSMTNALYIHSKICDDSIVDGHRNPLLRRLMMFEPGNWSTVLESPHYVPIKISEIIQQGGKGGVQVGGSLSSGQGSFMVPIESSNNTRKISNPNKVTVNMVSPTEQTIQMAEKQINATKRGVKRKRNLSRNHSSKRRRRVKSFSLPPSQTAIEKVYYQEVRSTSHINGSAPIEFIITGQNGMEFLDLKRSKLYIKVKIVQSDGKMLDATTLKVSPVNLPFYSMFDQVDVTMQGKLITSTTNHYPYKAMIQTLLSYGSGAKTSQLTSLMWSKDTPGYMDDYDVENTSNAGLARRAQFFEKSMSVDMEGPILHDLFQLDRYLINQVAVGVKLYRTRPEFCLMSNETGYEVVIEDIVLKACKVQVNPAVIYGQAEIMKNTNAKYPFTRTEVKLLTIPAGNISYTYDNLFQGLRPNRCCIGFVKSAAASGNFQLNPFNFANFRLTQIGVFVDGVPVGGNVMKLNFNPSSGRTIVPAYNSMFRNN